MIDVVIATAEIGRAAAGERRRRGARDAARARAAPPRPLVVLRGDRAAPVGPGRAAARRARRARASCSRARARSPRTRRQGRPTRDRRARRRTDRSRPLGVRSRVVHRRRGRLGREHMATSVIVIGGGVAGLTAAHELVERGFKVDVYEPRPAWGGKARTSRSPAPAPAAASDLPGEHGFRFYPRFYKHVIDTMARIPIAAAATSSITCSRRPRARSRSSIDDTWFRFCRQRVDQAVRHRSRRSSCSSRSSTSTTATSRCSPRRSSSSSRRATRAGSASTSRSRGGTSSRAICYSPKFQRQLRAVPRTMVAMDPKRGSARTVGTISMQLILDFATTGVNNDRTMGGPTSEMWFDPWIAHLDVARRRRCTRGTSDREHRRRRRHDHRRQARRRRRP